MPCLLHGAGEVAVCGSVRVYGGGGVCVHGVCPPWQLVVGTWRWAQMGECKDLDTLPSKHQRDEKDKHLILCILVYITLCIICIKYNCSRRLKSFVFTPDSVQDAANLDRNLHWNGDWDSLVYLAVKKGEGKKKKVKLKTVRK